MKKQLATVISTAAILVSPALLAEQPSYTYVEAGYTRLNLDDFNADPDGFVINGSYELNSDFFLRGRYTDVDDKVFGVTVDAQEFQAGIGYKTEIDENSSFYLAADYLNAEAEALNVSIDEDGFQLAAGLRGNLTESFELNAEVGYADFDDADGFVGSIGAVYHFAETFGVSLTLGTDEDSNTQTTFAVRASF